MTTQLNNLIDKYSYYIVSPNKTILLGSANDVENAKRQALDKLSPKINSFIGKDLILAKVKDTSKKFNKGDDSLGLIKGPVAIEFNHGTIENVNTINNSSKTGNNKYYITPNYIKNNLNNVKEDMKKIVKAYTKNLGNDTFTDIHSTDEIIKPIKTETTNDNNMSYDKDKYYLIYNNKEYEASNIAEIKKHIKSGAIPNPSDNEKVIVINFSQSKTYPLMVIIGQYTLTPKGALVMKDDDLSQTITFDNDTFNKTILNKIIKAYKNDEIDYSNSSMSYSKLATEKRHKNDYKRISGNIQKSRSDLHVNKKTGNREITTDMVIHKGLTAKEKAGLKKSILNAVKKHLSGSGLHIPLVGGYTSSLIFHEMGKYIPPKDRILMKKLIEESRPPRPPPIHSGVIDEEDSVAVIHPMINGNMSDSDYEDSGTESKSDIEPKYKYMTKEPDSDSDDDMEGMGFGQFMSAIKKTANLTKQAIVDKPRELRKAVDDRVAREQAKIPTGAGIRRTKLHNHGIPHPVLKRPRGRPRKIQL